MKIEKFKIGDFVKCFDPMLDLNYLGEVGKIHNTVELGNDSIILLIKYSDKSIHKVHAEYTTHYYDNNINGQDINITMKESEFMSILENAFSGAIDSIMYQLSDQKEDNADV